MIQKLVLIGLTFVQVQLARNFDYPVIQGAQASVIVVPGFQAATAGVSIRL